MVGDMNEEREGDGVAGYWRASGPLTAGVGEAARGVTKRDLEAAAAVNGRAHGGIRHQHTREMSTVGKPTGSGR